MPRRVGRWVATILQGHFERMDWLDAAPFQAKSKTKEVFERARLALGRVCGNRSRFVMDSPQHGHSSGII
jgi:hypothetical protein